MDKSIKESEKSIIPDDREPAVSDENGDSLLSDIQDKIPDDNRTPDDDISDGDTEQSNSNPSDERSKRDYSSDLIDLCRQFPEIAGSDAIGAVSSERYCQLRALGLTPGESYLAIGAGRGRIDNRSHLVTTVPVSSVAHELGMTQREMNEARELFGDLSDSEIKKLYKKVTR